MCNSSTGMLDSSEFTKSMPIIGLYIAGATLLCFLLMLIDILKSFSVQLYWIRCKLFGINAATLSLLSVATKLAVDLNTPMPGPLHQLTKISGTVLLCMAMGVTYPSLGTMKRVELLANMVALAILVITVAVNICIQMGTGAIFAYLHEHIMVLCIMLLLLSIEGVTALYKDAYCMEGISERKAEKCKSYASKHALCNTTDPETKLENCKNMLPKVWTVTSTGNPQRALNLMDISVPVCVLSLSSAILLLKTEVGTFVLLSKGKDYHSPGGGIFCKGGSEYSWSIQIVLGAQTIFVLLASLAICIRLFHCIAPLREPIEYMKNVLNDFLPATGRVLSTCLCLGGEYFPLKLEGAEYYGAIARQWVFNWAAAWCLQFLCIAWVISAVVGTILSMFPFLFRSILSRMSNKAKIKQGSSAINHQNSTLEDFIVFPSPQWHKYLYIPVKDPTVTWVKGGINSAARKATHLVQLLTTCLDDGIHMNYGQDPVWLSFRKHIDDHQGCCDLFLGGLALIIESLATRLGAAQQQHDAEAQKLVRAVQQARRLLRFVDKYVLDKDGTRGNARKFAELMWLELQAQSLRLDDDVKTRMERTHLMVALQMSTTYGVDNKSCDGIKGHMTAFCDILPLCDLQASDRVLDWFRPRIAYIMVHCLSTILDEMHKLGGEDQGFELHEEDVKEAAQVLGMLHGLKQQLFPLLRTIYNSHSACAPDV